MTDRNQPPAVTPFKDIHLDFPQCHTLSCGIPIWVINGGDEQVCQLGIFMAGGTLHEQSPLQSLLTALMCLEGSKRYNSRQIAELFDYHGAYKTALNHDAMSQFTMLTITEYYDRLLPFMVDALAQATFPAAELMLYKQRYAASYATMRSRVKHLAATQLRRLYYGDESPLVADIDPAEIMNIDVEQLKSFYRQYYHPSNCRIILAGRVDDQMLARTDEAFMQWNDPNDIAAKPMPLTINPSDQMLSVVDKPGSVQSAIEMVIRAVGRDHPDYLALRVLCTVLGGYFGSRLNVNIREEKGYTYGITAFLSGREQDGYIGVSTECDVSYTWKVIDEVKYEMRRLRKQPIGEDELNQVRQYMLSEQVKTLDTPFRVSSYVASTWLYGIYPDYYNQQIDTILHITPQRLHEMALRYLDIDQLRIVIAGDKNKM